MSRYPDSMKTGSERKSQVDTYLAPSGEQEELIAEFSAAVKDLTGQPVLRGADSVEVPVPPELFKILVNVANILQQGQGVTILRNDQLLTTQEGADLLGISRPTFVKMLEEGKVPFSKVGRHRRVTLQDVKSYSEEEQKRRSRLLNEMAALSQEAETFYEPPSDRHGAR